MDTLAKTGFLTRVTATQSRQTPPDLARCFRRGRGQRNDGQPRVAQFAAMCPTPPAPRSPQPPNGWAMCPNKIAVRWPRSGLIWWRLSSRRCRTWCSPEVMSSISEVLDETPLQPVIGVTNYLPEKEESVLFEMLSWRPSGRDNRGARTHRSSARDDAKCWGANCRDYGSGWRSY